MEEKELVICDSDVPIEFFDRGNKAIENRLVELNWRLLAISSITHSEIIFGMRNKKHQIALLRGLGSFRLVEIDSVIDSIHRKLIKHYGLSHGLRIQDAIVAATALKENHRLYTLNKKDFSFIAGIRII